MKDATEGADQVPKKEADDGEDGPIGGKPTPAWWLNAPKGAGAAESAAAEASGWQAGGKAPTRLAGRLSISGKTDTAAGQNDGQTEINHKTVETVEITSDGDVVSTVAPAPAPAAAPAAPAAPAAAPPANKDANRNSPAGG